MPYLLRVEKQYLKFSSAHFTLFPNSREMLHGHNYTVILEVESDALQEGMVVDFGPLKQTARAVCDRLDEKILLPETPRIQRAETDGAYELSIDGDAGYRFPKAEVVVLPIDNVTCEGLAYYIAHDVLQSRPQWDAQGNVNRLRIWVDESPGQQGGYEQKLP
ncbi:6-carboxytetrahydropterin synthase [bacterium]|nr:6-carboxytetrahydropterin synthase [bacterium]